MPDFAVRESDNTSTDFLGNIIRSSGTFFIHGGYLRTVVGPKCQTSLIKFDIASFFTVILRNQTPHTLLVLILFLSLNQILRKLIVVRYKVLRAVPPSSQLFKTHVCATFRGLS